MLAVAIVIVIILGWKWMAFRAYSVFCMLMAGISLMIAGWGIKTPEMTLTGAAFTATSVLILVVSSRTVEKSRRKTYMLHLFLWGMFIFVKICVICSIILLPLLSAIAVPLDMHKAVVLDSTGSRIRETYVDQNNKDLLTGEQLKDYHR
jgi:multisubunit Na+/H+ antiporter MnhB subunit